MPALTASEAPERAALLSVDSYAVTLDLTAAPVRSHTVIRFRCARPGADSFADLTAAPPAEPAAGLPAGGAVLNGVPLRPAANGRLALPALAAQNVLTAEAEVPERALTRFTEPDGAEYVLAFCYPTHAPDLFCCFDQLDLPAPLTLSLRARAGWTCVANGAVAERPPAGEAGTWRFAPLRLKPLEVSWWAGPLRSAPVDPAAGTALTLTSYARAGLSGAAAGYLARYSGLTAGAVAHYERELSVPLPYGKCDVVAVPDVPFRAACVPGLVLVGEDLLARLADPDDEFAAMIAAHETAHLWFGGLVGMRWWDDLWLEESLATYLSYRTDAGWAGFAWDEKPRALLADERPTTQPVCAPVATLDQALDRPNAITYVKGTAVIRQLAALIGPRAVTRGLTDYLARFAAAGSAGLDDLIGCWSRAAGTDLASWAQAWLRAAGTPSLSATVITSGGPAVAVTQRLPRPQRIGLALYDRLPGVRPGRTGPGGLRLRRTVPVELGAAETRLIGLAGEPVPAAVFANAGDWALAQVSLDPVSLAALAAVAFDVGDPLTEAALWNAAWHTVRTGRLASVDYAALAARRLARASAAESSSVESSSVESSVVESSVVESSAVESSAGGASATGPGQPSPLTAGAIAALLARAVTCADRYVSREARTAVRTAVADVALGAALTPGVSPARHRALLMGFAASVQTETHLTAARTLLDEAGEAGRAGPAVGRPVRYDLALRGALVLALAARGRARAADLDGLTADDPVAGEPLRAACTAAQPAPSAKQAAWATALDPHSPQRLARACAESFWVPGQEGLLAQYRDRYFTEALPALSAADARGDRRAARLARLLFPGLLGDPATVAAARAALDAGGLTGRVRAAVLDEETELRAVAAVRAARPPSLAVGPAGGPARSGTGPATRAGRYPGLAPRRPPG